MKKLLISLIVVATLAVPSILVADTSWSISGNSYGGVGISVQHHNRGSSYRHVTRRTTVVHGGNGYVNHRVIRHRPVVIHQGSRCKPPRHIYRQEGRRYINERYYSERIVVVPSGSSTYYYSGY